MRYNLNVPLLGYNGQPIKNNPDEKGRADEVILRDVLVNVINSERPDAEKSTSAVDKATVFRISNLVYKTSRPNLSASDVAFILKKAEANATPLSYGRLKEILDPDPEPEDEDEEPEAEPES